MTPDPRRPRFALPFTVLAAPDTVRLIAGEDFRYTLGGAGLDRWLPALLASFDGRRTVGEVLLQLDEAQRPPGLRIVDRLYAERVLVDGTAVEAHVPAPHRIVVEGRGPLTEGWPAGYGRPLALLCQDRLDYDEALKFNLRCLGGAVPWMWASVGAMARGYASPVFLPESGPCLACLLRQFRRRSPAPELYDALEEQGRRGEPIEPVPFPPEGVGMLRNLIVRKAALLADPAVPVAPFRLHVLEASTLEVSSHRVFLDPECEACRGRRR